MLLAKWLISVGSAEGLSGRRPKVDYWYLAGAKSSCLLRPAILYGKMNRDFLRKVFLTNPILARISGDETERLQSIVPGGIEAGQPWPLAGRHCRLCSIRLLGAAIGRRFVNVAELPLVR